MSRILRGGPRPSDASPLFLAPRRIPAEVVAAREEAARLLDEARREAAAVMDASRQEAAAILHAARAEGRAEGFAEAAAARIEAALRRDEALAEAEQTVARLALSAAERLLGETLDASPARVASIVADAVSRARRAREVVVHVHPDDAPHVESLRASIAARAGSAAVLAVRVDASLRRGGCVVDSELGTVDARLETRLDALARALGL